MKAIHIYEFGPPEVMRLEDTILPQIGPDQVLVDIKAAGVNPVDTYIRSGAYGPKDFPFTPGFDAAGIIAKTGENVRNISPGQHVFIAGSVTGTYAQQAICSLSQVHPLPESVSFEQGAALGVPYRTAYRALFQRAQAIKGETILIHGASGGVGIAAIQFAKAAGMKVIASAGSKNGWDLIEQQGANLILDHHDPSHLQKVLEFTDGQGVNVVLEMLANINLGNDLPILAKKGRVVIVGSRGTVQINPRDLMSREASVLGVMSALATKEENQQIFDAIDTGLRNGTLIPVVTLQLPLAEAPKAHREVMESAHHGKIVLIP